MTAPLPRSLDPAAGEILPGYLLRLAHRLAVAPLELGHLCGLTTGTVFPARHLVRLKDTQAQQVADVCRLHPAEAHALTLAGQAPGYTPLRIDYLGRHQSPVTMANDGWVLTAFSRYCPDCLSDTAHLPGGPVWQGSWRLPHTFLCERHNRLLAWQCPACRAPAFSNGYRSDGRWRPTQLIPAPAQRLHPARCRHRPGAGRVAACGQLLDQTGGPPLRPTPAMTHAHRRLAEAATAGAGREVASLGQRVSAQWFFNDVRATVSALLGSWPHPQNTLEAFGAMDALAPPEALHRTHPERSGELGDGRVARTFGHPPADTFLAATLMALTVAILDDSRGHHVLARLLSALPSTSTAHIRLRQHAPHCSPAMTEAIRGSVRLPRKSTGQPSLFPQPATHRGRLDPRTIPAVLPEHWAAPLDGLDAPRRQLRRDAAIRLVQMATGRSRRSAALYLGIPLGSLQSSTVTIRTWQKRPENAEAYQSALQRVAEMVMAEGQRNESGAPAG
ncbi:TniQ family protein [Streptomyces sp. RTGN2]|uniref:TniQ family protein n=1 Tax=Streptomyces sp. RTGN2 TaxID=3016525 RepID=UPI002555F460|nr:TniQ family protein [Streptomyces sp. RTGN2]